MVGKRFSMVRFCAYLIDRGGDDQTMGCVIARARRNLPPDFSRVAQLTPGAIAIQ
jgi:hypothetical protein